MFNSTVVVTQATAGQKCSSTCGASDPQAGPRLLSIYIVITDFDFENTQF